MEDADPDDLFLVLIFGLRVKGRLSYVEPGQSTARLTPWSFVTVPTEAFLKPINWHQPIDGNNSTEVFLLLVEIRGDVGAEQREKGGDSERFVAVANQLIVNGVSIKVNTEK